MSQSIRILLMQYLTELQKIYGSHLKSVILYGSYARGDYTPDSDIDIMLLVDLPTEEIENTPMSYQNLILNIMYNTMSG